MTNSNDERMTKAQMTKLPTLRHSCFVLISSFGFRHSSLSASRPLLPSLCYLLTLFRKAVYFFRLVDETRLQAVWLPQGSPISPAIFVYTPRL